MDFRNLVGRYPIGITLNNPLNVSTSGWQGEVGIFTNPQREAIFKDTVYSIRAAALLLNKYYNTYNLTSIRSIIDRYAPKNDPNAKNDPNSYANFVGNKTGIDPNANFELTESNLKAILKAMTAFEIGTSYAAMIPDSEYDEGIRLANIKNLVTGSAVGLGTVAFFFNSVVSNIKKKMKK